MCIHKTHKKAKFFKIVSGKNQRHVLKPWEYKLSSNYKQRETQKKMEIYRIPCQDLNIKSHGFQRFSQICGHILGSRKFK